MSSETIAAEKQNRAFGEMKRLEDVQVCECKKSGEGSRVNRKGSDKVHWASTA